jgi:hypothetical protein
MNVRNLAIGRCLVFLYFLRNIGPVHLSLSAEFINYLAIFFSYNKSANSTFNHAFFAKRIGFHSNACNVVISFSVMFRCDMIYDY